MEDNNADFQSNRLQQASIALKNARHTLRKSKLISAISQFRSQFTHWLQSLKRQPSTANSIAQFEVTGQITEPSPEKHIFWTYVRKLNRTTLETDSTVQTLADLCVNDESAEMEQDRKSLQTHIEENISILERSLANLHQIMTWQQQRENRQQLLARCQETEMALEGGITAVELTNLEKQLLEAKEATMSPLPLDEQTRFDSAFQKVRDRLASSEQGLFERFNKELDASLQTNEVNTNKQLQAARQLMSQAEELGVDVANWEAMVKAHTQYLEARRKFAPDKLDKLFEVQQLLAGASSLVQDKSCYQKLRLEIVSLQNELHDSMVIKFYEALVQQKQNDAHKIAQRLFDNKYPHCKAMRNHFLLLQDVYNLHEKKQYAQAAQNGQQLWEDLNNSPITIPDQFTQFIEQQILLNQIHLCITQHDYANASLHLLEIENTSEREKIVQVIKEKEETHFTEWKKQLEDSCKQQSLKLQGFFEEQSLEPSQWMLALSGLANQLTNTTNFINRASPLFQKNSLSTSDNITGFLKPVGQLMQRLNRLLSEIWKRENARQGTLSGEFIELKEVLSLLLTTLEKIKVKPSDLGPPAGKEILTLQRNIENCLKDFHPPDHRDLK